jgi:hypothetical protein
MNAQCGLGLTLTNFFLLAEEGSKANGVPNAATLGIFSSGSGQVFTASTQGWVDGLSAKR